MKNIVYGEYEMIKEYYCPLCEKGFDDPARYVLPCCRAQSDELDDGSQREKCRECGKIYAGDYVIPVCPHCDNDGSEGPEAGHWDCMESYREFQNKKEE